jgi:hypothetical protein
MRIALSRTLLVVLLALTAAVTLPAQNASSQKFEGILNDYSDAANAAGAWHMAGEWSVHIKGNSGKADFVASIAMVRVPSGASPHTHHITLSNAAVSELANGTGYLIEGQPRITTSGNLAGFTGSPTSIELVGGTAVLPSNIRITFQGGAAGHFGADPVEGVVELDRAS